jgi:hypothetical protein
MHITREQVKQEKDRNALAAILSAFDNGSFVPSNVLAAVEDRDDELAAGEQELVDAEPASGAEVTIERGTTRAEAEGAMLRKPLVAEPRPVKTFERGRWITREGTPRRYRRLSRPRSAGRPGRRARTGRAAQGPHGALAARRAATPTVNRGRK